MNPDVIRCLHYSLGPRVWVRAWADDAEPPTWMQSRVEDLDGLRRRLEVYGRVPYEAWLRSAAAGRMRALWVRVEGTKQSRALAGFRPAPTLVLREGETSRRWALWALSAGLDYEWTVRSNRRLAHRMARASKKHARPDEAEIPVTVLNHRRVPLPIEIETFERRVYRAREIVGHLRDAPDPDSWRQRL